MGKKSKKKGRGDTAEKGDCLGINRGSSRKTRKLRCSNKQGVWEKGFETTHKTNL